MSASIKVDITKLGRLSQRVQKFLNDATDKDVMLDAIGVALVSNVQTRFEQGRGPDGQPWAPVKRGGSPLVDSGLMRDSMTYDVNGSTVRVGTNRIQAKTHQFGATIKPKKAKVLAFTVKGKAVFAKQVTIPARPFLGINKDDINSIRGTIADHMLASHRGAY